MYPLPEGCSPQNRPGGGPNKVDVVCDALRSAMETLDQNKSVLDYSMEKILNYSV